MIIDRRAKIIAGSSAGLVACVVAAGCEYATTHQGTEAAEALLCCALGCAIVWFALILPGVTGHGLAIGGFFACAGMLSWSYADRPGVVWSLLALEGVVFLAWSRPWTHHLRASLSIGGAWLGVSYWLVGIVGAVLVLHPGVATQRVLYAGVFGLAVLAVIAKTGVEDGKDLSPGIIAAFLLALAALVISGSGNLLDDHHVVVPGPWGEQMDYRFWGGPWLLYHPNSMAGIAVAAAIRIGLDRRFAAWQRLASIVLASCVIHVTDSRTGFVFFAAAASVHAGLLLLARRRPVTGLPRYEGKRALVAAAAPFLVLAMVVAGSGGISNQLLTSRYDPGGDDGTLLIFPSVTSTVPVDVTSGRAATWEQVGRDWQSAGLAEKLFGDAHDARATVVRADSGGDVKLTTDNAAVGALRRGGVIGVGSFCFGLWLLLLHARRSRAPAWFLAAALAALPTVATTDWVLGGTGGTLWILLVAGEVRAAYQ
ncbi:MAG: hypothetical protein JXA67_15635, partial [Micromonosporaceae bacterium]|nr:hypothetical protein [Micromonosporaceae bacterium]